MGGYGSTRWDYHQKKRLVDECLQLDMLKFNQWGLIPGSHSCGTTGWKNDRDEILAYVSYELFPQPDCYIFRLNYTVEAGGDKHNLQYDVKVVSTTLHNRGNRWWFVCPLIVNGRKCERRVRILYLPPGEIYFGCRHCYRLTYRSCQERDKIAAELSLLPVDQLREMMQSGSVKSRLQAARALNVKLGI